MPSVFSRLSPYLTPQWLVTFAAVLIAMRLLRRWQQTAAARAQLAAAQAVKRQQRATDNALVEQALASSASERGSADAALSAMSATSLVGKMASGSLSARLVLHALLARVQVAQAKFNVLSETNYRQALDDAEKVDQHLKSTGAPLGRLHGLPISVKDSVNLAGLDTTLGLTRFVGVPAEKDALIVQLLKAQGAVFPMKSNIPQTLLSFECCNPLHGRTLHPLNPKLTPGGSSGGESALLTAGASLVGIGTDIGGSVRIPAHFSGNVALKPTARRLSLQGFRASVPGQEAIPAVAGPMAQRVEDLSLLLRELWTPAAWARDADLAPVPFDEAEVANDKKLRVGWYVDDGFIAASPACARAVREAAEALKAAGHDVTEFRPTHLPETIAMYYSLITSDNCQTLSKQLDGEVWEDYCKTMITGVRLPSPLKSAVGMVMEHVLHDPKAASIVRSSRERSTAEVWALQAARKGLRQAFQDSWRAAGDFDVVLCPAHVLPAVPHHTFKKISFTCSYTLVFNVLDLPAGIVPVTRVDKTRDAYTSPPTSLLDKAARGAYKLDDQNGMPLGVQVVGKPFKDETVLRAMRAIEAAVQWHKA